MNLLNTIFNVIFPSYCLACRDEGDFLCLECLAEFPAAERECERWVFPLYDYRHPPVKKAIWLLKYKNRKTLAKIFARAMYYKIAEELSELSVLENFKDPLLIPIPLSNKRHRERGFNQSELLCVNLIKLDESKKSFHLCKDVLLKRKETEHQALIKDRAKRLKNLANSFTIKNERLVKQRNIILIDDVTTTGATLKEARKILKQAGAKKIIAFTLAH